LNIGFREVLGDADGRLGPLWKREKMTFVPPHSEQRTSSTHESMTVPSA
jgi:hypothetical protein